MAFSFFPKTTKFFDIMIEQNRRMVKSVSILSDLFQNFTDVEDKCQKITIAQATGHEISRNISKQLSMTFITPIDREDIHEINLAQKHILGLIKAISTRLNLCGFTEIPERAQRLVELLKLMIDEVSIVLNKLEKKQDAEKSFEKIDTLKYECEMILLVAMGSTFDQECQDPSAILDIIKWSQIYDRIEQAIGRTEALSDTLEGIMLKNA